MKTQSQDTSIEAEGILLDLIRKAPAWKRFQLIQSMTQGSFLANLQGDGNERETAIHFGSILYDAHLAQQLHTALMMDTSRHLHPVDLATLISEIAQVLDELNAEWYLGGSLASSLHGVQQLAQDVDFVVHLEPQHISTLLSRLKEEYVYASQHSSFSCIHLASLMKVDIILPSLGTFDLVMKQLVTPLVLDERYPACPVASASEMILFKLYRYSQDLSSRKDGLRNDAEWNDVLGMLKLQGKKLDLPLLERSSKALNIVNVWQSALMDAGLKAA